MVPWLYFYQIWSDAAHNKRTNVVIWAKCIEICDIQPIFVESVEYARYAVTVRRYFGAAHRTMWFVMTLGDLESHSWLKTLNLNNVVAGRDDGLTSQNARCLVSLRDGL